jgi:hypothetical protein
MKQQISSTEEFDKIWNGRFRPEFYSSAQRLDSDLRQKRITLPFQIFYKYALPNDATPAVFEADLKPIWGRVIFDTIESGSDYKINPEIKKQLKQQRGTYLVRLKSLINEIRRLNPELAGIRTKTDKEMLGLADGACYGFGPLEIQFFIQRKRNIQNDPLHYSPHQLRVMKRALGGAPVDYILTPEHADQLTAALEKYMDTPTDEYGRVDTTGALGFVQGRNYGD